MACGWAIVAGGSASGQTYFNLSGGNYSQDFTEVANWTTIATDSFSGVAAAGSGIPAATAVTAASTSFQTNGTSSGVQKGTGNIIFLSTGTTDNSTSVALDLNLNATNRTIGMLSFDAATINNGTTGNRVGTLRVYTSPDGTTWTELAGTGLPYVSTNLSTTGTTNVSLPLPAGLSGQATAKVRFYYHNGSGGNAGSRPKISVDNVGVTSTPSSIPDTTKPTITAKSPADDGADVVLNPPFSITFSEAVIAGAGSIRVFPPTGPAIVVPASSATITGNSVSFALPSSLSHSTAYYVQIDANAFADAAGNTFLGILSPDTTTWNFTTVAPDTAPPVPELYLPAAGSTTVPKGTFASEVTFDEEVEVMGTAVAQLLDADNGDAPLRTINATNADILYYGVGTVGLGFNYELLAGHNYKIKLSAGAVRDAAGNLSDEVVWAFKTFDIGQMKVAVNKFNSTDPDTVELLVIANGPGTTLNMQGMILKDYSDNTNMDNGGAYSFAAAPEWAAVPAGTLIVLSDSPLTGTPPAEEFDLTDRVIHANLRNATYFAVDDAGFNIGGTDIVQIKAAGSGYAGSAGAIHTLSSGNGSYYTGAPEPKTKTALSGANVSVTNANGVADDFNLPTGAGTDPKTFGLPSSEGNTAFIDYLRGTQSLSLNLAAASRIVAENAPIQTDALTVTLPATAVSDVTITVSASPAGIVTVPASVVVPAGSKTVSFPFTPVNDGVFAGNRTVVITTSGTGLTSASAQVITTEAQFVAPTVVINKYLNLGTNNPDVVELLVVQNNLDMRGMIIKDFSVDMDGDNGGGYTFKDVPLWQSVPSGTLIVLVRDATNPTTLVEEFDASDYVVTVKLGNETYFANTPAITNGSFDIGGNDFVMIKAAGSPVAGLSGNIHSLGGGTTVGSQFKLTAAPKALSDTSTGGGGLSVQVLNSTSTLADFNGIDTKGNVDLSALIGMPNNTTNQTYILSLRTAPPSGYGSWATANAGGQSASGDFDNDGVKNGIEYFLGATGSSFTSLPGLVNGTITWPKGASVTGTYGDKFYVQTSTTLAADSWTTVPVGSVTLTSNSLSYTPPTGAGKTFIRLVVVAP